MLQLCSDESFNLNVKVNMLLLCVDCDGTSAQCVHCTVFFSFRPRAVGHIVQPWDCHIIEHIFVPTLSVERNIEKIRFLWVSNSKFVNFPQIFPCSNYKSAPLFPLLFPDSNGDSPVATIFPCSYYGGFFTTGEYYCTMYTLCNGANTRCTFWILFFYDIPHQC